MKIAIVGVGLIGGSIGLAIKSKRLASKVIGIGRRPESLKKALELGCIDEAFDDLKRAEDADFIFLATPPLAIIEIGKKLSEFAKDSIVTDAGSTKEEIVRELTPIFPYFVGAHPMAGSHKTGPEFASSSLFLGSQVVITPINETDRWAKEAVANLWRKMGARIIEMPPSEHDRLVALSSHIPHILSFILVNLIKKEGAESLISTGFNDMARLSLSNPVLWNEIGMTNKSNILAGLSELRCLIEEWQDAFKDEGKFLEKLQQTQSYAKDLIIPK
ncbi:prephenate dehydrogenase/arogenate dehydrogenase family protein [bacterium]|nr:prephenate dehydrogenase/arogenate dehydrogenase family protein [bacterium]